MSSTLGYAYRAARPDGGLEHGVVDAQGRDEAVTLLLERGLFPIEVRDESRGVRAFRRLPTGELALGLHLLADLIAAGLPITRALAAFSEVAPAGWKSGLPRIGEAVRQGRTLSSALDSGGLDIPSVIIGMIQSGESGEQLARAVHRAAETAERWARTSESFRNALTYPLILLLAGSSAMVMLVGVVLPRFAGLLTDLGQSLPLSTRLVLGAAAGTRALTVPALVVLVVAAVGWKAWTGQARGLERWHDFLRHVPVLGEVRWSAATARVSASLAALLEVGVPVSAALVYAARAAGDAYVGAALMRARELVVRGQGVAVACATEAALTPAAVRLVRAGEESGRLAAMLAHAATLEERRATAATQRAVRLIEPAIIIGFGSAVALVAAALLQAVYGVRMTP